jgi:hypothetical protein
MRPVVSLRSGRGPTTGCSRPGYRAPNSKAGFVIVDCLDQEDTLQTRLAAEPRPFG